MQDFQPTKKFYRVRQTVFIDFARIRIMDNRTRNGAGKTLSAHYKDSNLGPVRWTSNPLDIDFHWTSIARSPTNRRTTVLSHKNCLKDKLISRNNDR